MKVTLGVAPIGWTNDDLPELGGDIPLEQCLREAAEAGYRGIEKGGKFPNDPGRLQELLDRHGLRLITGWFSGELYARHIEEEKRRIAAHVHLLATLGCPVLVYAETTRTVQGRIDVPLSARPRMPREDIGRYGEKLTVFAEWLRLEGLALSFHHHMGTMIETGEEIDRLMEHTGEAVGLLLDTGHLHYAGGDVEATCRRWGGRINHVHCKNVRQAVLEQARARDWSFLHAVREGVFTVPGDPEGCIDYRRFAKLLAEIGYEGWVVVEAEQDPARANPLEYARMGRRELVEAFTAAGYEVA